MTARMIKNPARSLYPFVTRHHSNTAAQSVNTYFMEILQRNIKVALVGDAHVGKTHWVNLMVAAEDTDDYILQTHWTIGGCMFDIWDISGSHSAPQDRAKWIEDSDAAIIMVDLADQESINNTILWYREIKSSQQDSDNPKHLPIMIYGYKAYKDDAKYKIKPTEISWPEEIGSTPFHYNEYVDETIYEEVILACESRARPYSWIWGQLTGQPEVDIFVRPTCDLTNRISPPSPRTLEKWKRQKQDACEAGSLPDDSDGDL